MQSSLVLLVLLGQWSFAFHRFCSPPLPAASTHPTKLFRLDPNSAFAAAWATGSAHCSSSVPTCSHPRWAKCSQRASFTLPLPKAKLLSLLCPQHLWKLFFGLFWVLVGFFLFLNPTEQKFCLAPWPLHAACLPLKTSPHGKQAAERVKIDLPTCASLNSSHEAQTKTSQAAILMKGPKPLCVFLALGFFPPWNRENKH